MRNITFNKALEIVDSLPENQRNSLIEIVKNRLIEERRNRLAKSIKNAKEEYTHGEVRKGTVEDIMHEVLK